jgi:hypothetical protein
VKLNTTPRASIKDPDLQRELREHASQVNQLSEGRMSAKYSALDAPPSTGAYEVGDYVPNKTTAIVGTAPNRYIVNGWRCVVAGEPATFVECKELVDPPMNDPAPPAPEIPQTVYVGRPMMALPAPGVYVSNIIGGALTTQNSAANRQDISPYLAAYDFSIDEVGLSVVTSATGNACVLIFEADANGRPGDLLFQSANMATNTTGTKLVAGSFSFDAGRMYWIGTWTSGAPELRVANNSSHYSVAWTTAATPASQSVLRRTETYGTATDWVYASSQHASSNPAFVLMRIA